MKTPWVAALLNLVPGLLVFMPLFWLGNFIPLGFVLEPPPKIRGGVPFVAVGGTRSEGD